MPASREKRVLSLLGDVMGLLELDELCRGMLVALREAVPAEFCALNELPADLPHTFSLSDPPLPEDMHVTFARYGLQNPLVQHYLTTHDGRARRLSEVASRRELHALDLYRELYKPLGVEYQIAVILPSAAQRVLGIALSRGRRDFTAAERDLLNLARPFLIQAYRNALAYTAMTQGAGRRIAPGELIALGLTERQSEVLRLVAMGCSDQDAAGTLGIAVRTVQKHLEHCYRRLGVTNRSQAARAAWEAAV